MSPDPLVTPRLVLRPWRDDDAATVLDIYSREDVWRWLGSPPRPCADLSDARARIARWSSRGSTELDSFWAVETPGVDGVRPQPCGTVLLVPLPRSDGSETSAYEIGWHLHPSAWGHGIATEAATALLAAGRVAGLREVHAVVYPDNARSLAVCDRLGFTRLGVTDEWYGETLVDHVLAMAPA